MRQLMDCGTKSPRSEPRPALSRTSSTAEIRTTSSPRSFTPGDEPLRTDQGRRTRRTLTNPLKGGGSHTFAKVRLGPSRTPTNKVRKSSPRFANVRLDQKPHKTPRKRRGGKRLIYPPHALTAAELYIRPNTTRSAIYARE